MKLTYIGSGSAIFARRILTDVLRIDGLSGGTLALVDTNPEKLELSRRLVEMLVAASAKEWRVVASEDRCEVLEGSDYVVNSIEVGGLANVGHEYTIPMKYGVDQSVADTIGPGGIFKALRTGPDWLDIVHDVERLCPRAILMNYTNPLSALTLAALRVSQLQIVGLCTASKGHHANSPITWRSPTTTSLGTVLGSITTAGSRCSSGGVEDLYPVLRERARVPEVYERDPVRFEVMLELGAFVSESSGHFSEYVPYFRKRPDLLRRYTGTGALGESGLAARLYPISRPASMQWLRDVVNGAIPLPFDSRSTESAADIVEAVEFNRPKVIYGNVRNSGLIDNLVDGCVEVATLVDGRGLMPCHFGVLPEQLAALNRSHMSVHELLVRALVERDRQAALHALMLDPLTAAVCSLAEIRSMFDELWEAEKTYLTAFT